MSGFLKTWPINKANNKAADRPAHPHQVISVFVIPFYINLIAYGYDLYPYLVENSDDRFS